MTLRRLFVLSERWWTGWARAEAIMAAAHGRQTPKGGRQLQPSLPEEGVIQVLAAAYFLRRKVRRLGGSSWAAANSRHATATAAFPTRVVRALWASGKSAGSRIRTGSACLETMARENVYHRRRGAGSNDELTFSWAAGGWHRGQWRLVCYRVPSVQSWTPFGCRESTSRQTRIDECTDLPHGRQWRHF